MPVNVQSFLDGSACYLCYGASTEDALELQLLASISGTTGGNGPSTPTPLLNISGSVLTWTVSGPTPQIARIEKSADGVTGWSVVSLVTWTDGTATMSDSNAFYRVRGFSPPTTPITGYSNVVNIPLHALATSWSARVVTNGGAAPSAASVLAISNFCYYLDANGLTSLIIAASAFAPDSLIACLTPFIVGPGLVQWANVSNLFQAADLNVNGLLGNGSTKWIGTGVIPSAAYSQDNSASLFCYESTTTTGTHVPMGMAANLSTRALELYTNSFGVGATLFDCWDNDSAHGRVDSGAGGPTSAGFWVGTRTAANAAAIYFANSTSPWAVKASSANLSTGTHADCITKDVGIFCTNATTGTFFFSDRRMSFAGIGLGFTSAQGQALYNGVQTLRQAFGGGFV